MFEQPEDLAPDLEWMLGSDQVPRDIILEALVEEHYAKIYRLALSVLSDPGAAKQATQATIAHALANQYSYRVNMGVDIWLNRFTLEACSKEDRSVGQKVARAASQGIGNGPVGTAPPAPEGNLDAQIGSEYDALSLRARFALSLYCLFHWTIPKISTVIDGSEESTRSLIEHALDNLRGKLLAPGGPNASKSDDDLESQLGAALASHWPGSDTSTHNQDQAVQEIEELSGRMSLRRRGLSHFKEIMLVLLVILCGTAVIWGSSTVFIGEEEGEKSQLNTVITQIVYVTPKELTPEPSLTRSTPSPTPAPEDVFYRVKDNESYADIAAESGVSEAELRRLNRLSPEEGAVPGQHLLIPGRLEPQPPAATPVAPSRQLRPLEEPVSMEDIFQRLRVGTRASKTLWFEAMLVDFGPIGYIGPPNRLRAQVWFSDAQILVIAGDPQRGAEEVLVWSDGVWHQAVPGDNQPWFVTQNEINPQGIRTYPQLDLMFNTIFGDTGELGMIASSNTIGRASWAGQPVLHVTGEDRQHRHRISFWFDDSHGMILRKQWFTTADPEIVAQEIAVTAIEFDVDFPQELFDLHLPWRGSFALNVNGAPEPPTSFETPAFIQQASRPNPLNDPGISALQEDNFNYGQLLFFYHEDFESGDLSSSAEVYLDRQHLGSAQIGNPWTMVCQRSADGRNLAYVSRPNRAEPAGSELNWLFLDALTGNDHHLEGFAVTHFAWAPDSRRLAVFGYDSEDPFNIGKLFILDSVTGELSPLFSADALNSIVWRPDGGELAMIVRPQADSFEEWIMVLDVESGNVVSRVPIDILNSQQDRWPTEDWEVEFPVLMGDFENCAAPPELQ